MKLAGRLALTVAVAALTVGLGGVPATATPGGSGYVDGDGGAATNDWAGEGVVNQSTNARSAAAGLWQAFLFSQGYLGSWADVDCSFGPNTASATRKFQADRGLTVDGSAGPQSFGAADNALRLAPDGAYDQVLAGTGARTVSYLRVTGNIYAFQYQATKGAWLYASYANRTSLC